jgi:hypothetical protein
MFVSQATLGTVCWRSHKCDVVVKEEEIDVLKVNLEASELEELG